MLLALALAALYWLTRQPGFYGDGIYYVGLVKGGVAAHAHVLYLPLFRAVRWLAAHSVPCTDLQVLQGISVLAAACYGPLLWRCLGLMVPASTRGSRAAALVACMLAPGFWSFAGATENHALNATACLWAMVAVMRHGLWHPISLLAWASACGTHLTGVLFGPTLLLLAGRRDPSAAVARPGGFVVAGAVYLALAAATFGLGWLVDPEPVGNYFRMLLEYRPDLGRLALAEYLWVEGPLRMGLLAAAPACAWRLGRRDLRLTLALGLPVLFYVAAAAKVRAVEHGAYFVPFYAPLAALALGATVGAGRSARLARVVLALVACCQVPWGLAGRALPRDAEELVARGLHAVLTPRDRLFIYLREWKPMLYAEYYLGAAFDPLTTNLATVDPASGFGARAEQQHHVAPEQLLRDEVARTLRAGGRVLLDESLVPPTASAARAFVDRLARDFHAVRVQAAGGSFQLLAP